MVDYDSDCDHDRNCISTSQGCGAPYAYIKAQERTNKMERLIKEDAAFQISEPYDLAFLTQTIQEYHPDRYRNLDLYRQAHKFRWLIRRNIKEQAAFYKNASTVLLALKTH